MSHRIHIQAKIQVCASHPRSQSNAALCDSSRTRAWETSRLCDTTSIFFTPPHKLFHKVFSHELDAGQLSSVRDEKKLLYILKHTACTSVQAFHILQFLFKSVSILHFDDFLSSAYPTSSYPTSSVPPPVITCPAFFPPSAGKFSYSDSQLEADGFLSYSVLNGL